MSLADRLDNVHRAQQPAAAATGNAPERPRVIDPFAAVKASVHQALFVSNGPTIRGWLGTLTNRLQAVNNPRAVADELYLAVLTRPPTA